MKKFIYIPLFIIILIFISIISLGYFGPRVFQSSGTVPSSHVIAQKARELSWTPYDPLMGKYNNFGGRLGFIVCSDVPNIAYGKAGYSIRRMLYDDFFRTPSNYDSNNGNTPNNPYFHRRARNLFSYFKGNKLFQESTAVPAVGDLAFYTKSKNSYISHVALVTKVIGAKYWIMESAPKTIFAQEVEGISPQKRGWLLVGFGKM